MLCMLLCCVHHWQEFEVVQKMWTLTLVSTPDEIFGVDARHEMLLVFQSTAESRERIAVRSCTTLQTRPIRAYSYDAVVNNSCYLILRTLIQSKTSRREHPPETGLREMCRFFCRGEVSGTFLQPQRCMHNAVADARQYHSAHPTQKLFLHSRI